MDKRIKQITQIEALETETMCVGWLVCCVFAFSKKCTHIDSYVYMDYMTEMILKSIHIEHVKWIIWLVKRK